MQSFGTASVESPRPSQLSHVPSSQARFLLCKTDWRVRQEAPGARGLGERPPQAQRLLGLVPGDPANPGLVPQPQGSREHGRAGGRVAGPSLEGPSLEGPSLEGTGTLCAGPGRWPELRTTGQEGPILGVGPADSMWPPTAACRTEGPAPTKTQGTVGSQHPEHRDLVAVGPPHHV